eukprot:162209_1
MICIIRTYALNSIHNKQFKKYKYKIIEYFKQHKINGKTFNKMRNKNFANDIGNYIGCIEFKKELQQLYNVIKSYKSVSNDKDEGKTDVIIDIGAVSDKEIELICKKEENEIRTNLVDEIDYKTDESEKCVFENVNCIKDCNEKQMIYILKNDILNRSELDKINNDGKQIIIDYFISDEIDGNKFVNIKKMILIKTLTDKIGNKKMRGPLTKLYTILQKYDVSIFINELNHSINNIKTIEDCDEYQVFNILKH